MMPMTRDEKKNIVADHFGGLISYLHAVKALAEIGSDSKTKCAIAMLVDGAEQSVCDAQDLFDELMEAGQ